MATTTHPLSPRSQATLDRFRAIAGQAGVTDAEFVDRVRRRVAMFERIHNMTSAEMRTRLDAGTITETDDICSWLIQLDLLERVSAET